MYECLHRFLRTTAFLRIRPIILSFVVGVVFKFKQKLILHRPTAYIGESWIEWSEVDLCAILSTIMDSMLGPGKISNVFRTVWIPKMRQES